MINTYEVVGTKNYNFYKNTNMPNTKQLWEVSELNPWPDNYIAIFCSVKKCLKKKQEYSHHTELQQALERARFLKVKYGVKQIRLFYPNRVSIIIKSKNDDNIDFEPIRYGGV